MSQSVIGSLRVNLGLDSAQFERGARRVQNPLNQMRNQFMAVAGAAAAFGAAISAAASRGAADIDATAKAARRLDASATGFRTLELVADEAGVSLSSLTNDIQSMNREIANIGTSGNAQRALGQIGIAVAELDGLDVDEKMALIADRIQEMGLSAGEATAVLRDLGVRNREMALLVLQGGDALRQARADLESYGLALNSVDTARIEAANDAIGRLGLIGRYAAQQLALELTPALGRMANAMTESLREGGALRATIDALADNVQRLATWVGVAVAAFGARFVAALVAARIATFTLAGAMVALRAAMVRTGIGILVVGAGELVYQFGRLVSATGSFGEALSAVGSVASEVMGRIASGFEGVWNIAVAAATGIASTFVEAAGRILRPYQQLFNFLADGFNRFTEFTGITITAPAATISDDLRGIADDLEGRAIAAAGRAGEAFQRMTAPLDSIRVLRETIGGVTDELEGASDAGGDFQGAVEDVADAAGGGGGGAAGAIGDMADNVAELRSEMEGGAGTLADFFISIGQGADSARRAIQQLATSLLRSGLTQLFTNAGANNPGGFFGTILRGLSGARAAGGPVSKGASYLVGERGPEIFTAPQTGSIIPNHAMGNEGRAVVNVKIENNAPGVQVTDGGTASINGVQTRRFIVSTVQQAMADGQLDRTMGSRFGSSPQRVRR